MTKLITFFSLTCLICTNLFSQISLNWQNPLPQGNTLHDIFVLNKDTAIAVGDGGTVMKTIDGGETWNIQHIGDDFYNLYAVFFINVSTGWAVGGQEPNYNTSSGIAATILKTTDEGETWNCNMDYKHLLHRDVLFTNPDTGWICGWGGIFKTIDGGETLIPKEVSDCFNAIFFVNDSVGWAVGETIYKTSDYGESWIKSRPTDEDIPPGLNANLTDVYFVNSDSGYITGKNGLSSTTDGGKTWVIQYGSRHLESVYFINSEIGWAVGPYGFLIKTEDSGTNWIEQIMDNTTSGNAIAFANINSGWIVGNSGHISNTKDGGGKWEIQAGKSSCRPYELLDVCFIDNQNGWIVGERGVILKTANGGINWQLQTSGITNLLYSTFFVNDSTGWAVGDQGVVLKTTNGGTTWKSQGNNHPPGFMAVYFISDSIGWIGGYGGTIQKTTNGGEKWVSKPTGTAFSICSLYFLNDSIGWAAGRAGVILKTIDSGENWVVTHCETEISFLWNIHFIDAEHGWAVGANGEILASTDGGINWVQQYFDANLFLRDVYFYNQNTGIVVGDDGTILKTTDGGTNWVREFSISANNYKAFCFPEEKDGWVVGEAGSILKISLDNNTGVSENIYSENQFPVQLQLFPNYPNPFNNSTTFHFMVAKTDHVILIIYDILGQKVETVLNEKLNAGDYRINWSAKSLSSGIYFYQLQAGELTKTKKLLFVQ